MSNPWAEPYNNLREQGGQKPKPQLSNIPTTSKKPTTIDDFSGYINPATGADRQATAYSNYKAGGGDAAMAQGRGTRQDIIKQGAKNINRYDGGPRLQPKPKRPTKAITPTASTASTTAITPIASTTSTSTTSGIARGPGPRKPKPERPAAVGTLGKTSFERRLPTSAELRAAQAERAKQKAAGEDTSSVANAEKALQAAQKTNLPTTGPSADLATGRSSVEADKAKANTPDALNKLAPAGSALAAEQERRKKEMAAKGNPSLLSQTRQEETVIKKYLVREGYISEKTDLPGDQEKIDANKNGKIDADDFKLLRAGKKAAKTAGNMAKSIMHSEPGNEGKMTKV